MKQKIFLIVGILLLSFFGVSIYNEFMANHTYYQTMLASRANWKLFVWAIVAVLIPLVYIIKGKTFSVKSFFMYVIPTTLWLYTTIFVVTKDTIIGWSTGWIILMINTLLIYFLGIYTLLGLTALGTFISKKYIQFKETRRQEMVINFGIGLGFFLLLIYILTMVHLLLWAIVWIVFLGLGYIVYYMRKDLNIYKEIIIDITHQFTWENLKQNGWKRLGVILLGVSLIYYLYGFQLSIIPYSTAWDANHEYMYIPKILAENHGVLRGNMGPGAMAPGLRHVFITFWFALITPIKSRFWMAPDTIAVAMNFLSWMLVLIFGTGLIKEVIAYFTAKKDEDDLATTLGFYSGWMMLLFRLTSGMGAFLVFVDNKTDLWVMALIILAMLSGFIFLRYVLQTREHGLKMHRDSLKYIIISWSMFALALMAKQTAFIDITLFGLLMIGLWINRIVALGIWSMTLGMMWVMKIANAPDMMNPIAWKYLMVLGVIIVVLGFVHLFIKKQRTDDTKKLIKYIGIRALTIVVILLVFKGPNILINQINNGTFSPTNFLKSTLLVQKDSPKILLATTNAGAVIEQTAVDKEVIDTMNLTPKQCVDIQFTEGDLSWGMRKAITTNEDVGRYVWYGWKEITKWWWLNLGYGLLRIFTPKDNTCYGINSQARLLCKNAQAIENFNIPTLQTVFNQLKPGTQAYNILSWAIATYKKKWSGSIINPVEYRDQIMSIKKYYQDHAIATQAGKIHIPYRYLTPFNIVFNRSLQNLSSYYTDIGYIRLIIMMLLVFWFVYAIAHIKHIKKENNIAVIAWISIMWRAIRWIIGWGILWYGMGLIVWTVIAVALTLKDMFARSHNEKDKTMLYIVLFLFVIRWLVQLVLNFVRISSQGGGGPFLRYRMNNGKAIEITSDLQQKEIITSNYGRKDVFDLQFPHYNKFIEYVQERKNEDGVLIAGTYIQYFLGNQYNLKNDGMLSWFREQTSDGNMCKSYQRIKKANIKYLVIDPNIWTVVMGEGNESLFNRFFAKKDPVTWKIQEDGAISMLVKLRNAGFINLFSTNNLGAKYAFSLDDATLIAKFGNMSTDELVFLRAKLAIARFFPDAQDLVNFIAETFTNRVSNGKAVGDIADVYGKIIDEAKVYTTANTILSQQWTPEQLQKNVEWLTQEERTILTQYLGLTNLLKGNGAQYQEFLNNIIGQSLGGGSQLIVFELN